MRTRIPRALAVGVCQDDGTRRCPVLEKKGRNPDKGHYFDFREKTV